VRRAAPEEGPALSGVDGAARLEDGEYRRTDVGEMFGVLEFDDTAPLGSPTFNCAGATSSTTGATSDDDPPRLAFEPLGPDALATTTGHNKEPVSGFFSRVLGRRPCRAASSGVYTGSGISRIGQRWLADTVRARPRVEQLTHRHFRTSAVPWSRPRELAELLVQRPPQNHKTDLPSRSRIFDLCWFESPATMTARWSSAAPP